MNAGSVRLAVALVALALIALGRLHAPAAPDAAEPAGVATRTAAVPR